VSRLKRIEAAPGHSWGDNVQQFLQGLGGPAAILLPGVDRSRRRALVTLLHGNEPSGAIALQKWLVSGRRPAVDILCVVASVTAALERPLFRHRMLPRARDLNRCFRPPFDDAQGELAEEILDVLREFNPEAVVDMHNTSGSGPAFGVCTHIDPQHDALVSLFTGRLVISNLNLGALMEISDYRCPTVTVEVGGRLDEEAHHLAQEGIERYFLDDQVLVPGKTDWGLELLHDPIRLELREGVSLTYAEAAKESYDITLKPDIEHHNFGAVGAGTLLGWTRGDPRALFTAQDAGGRCALDSLVRIEGGALYPAQPLKLFMITNNTAIAESDCLFYAVHDDGSAVCS
jgi:Succinylglutamate desuccinylase / Aspartoacylase family